MSIQNKIETGSISKGGSNIIDGIQDSVRDTGSTENSKLVDETGIRSAIIAAINDLINSSGGAGINTIITVVAAESTTGSDNDLMYCIETETIYRYESNGSALTDDNEFILSTGDGGDTRWKGVSGKYIYDDANFKSMTIGSSTIQKVGDDMVLSDDTGSYTLTQLSAGGTPTNLLAGGDFSDESLWTVE